ncbi:MAG: bifunctional DNA primase/polymerase [Chloroflexota bacterium]|nr:bifunctional DNA primase/polymerase [Chloroflexota bacterium]
MANDTPPETDGPLGAAISYCRLGFSPVPVPHRQKKPALPEWQHLRISEESAPQFFSISTGNIGLLCGTASGNYVDVDLDSPQAVMLAPQFLPPTSMIHGHTSNPRSHWGYRAAGLPENRSFKDDAATLVELHSGRKAGTVEESCGKQVVAPPSIHQETGEVIRWESGCGPNPAPVEGQLLALSVRDLASTLLLSRHWPGKGSRHLAALALAGWLLRNGVGHDRAHRIVEGAARAAGDEEAPERAAGVWDTIGKLKAGQEVTGRPTLEPLLGTSGPAILDRVAAWLNLSRTAPSVRACDQSPGARPATEAYSGLAGRVVESIDGYSEADPAGVLAHFLAAFGNAVGVGPHCMVGATPHLPRENFVVVGRTSKARKGESASHMRLLFAEGDPGWVTDCLTTGLSTGEGLIWAVRDAIYKAEPKKDDGKLVAVEEVLVDAGVEDKRLLVLEPEFSRVLKVMGREGNTLSAVIRDAFDSGNLRVMTRAHAAVATGAHIAIVGHITSEELKRDLHDTDLFNGFANRFLWFLVRRSKLLPEPPPFEGHEVTALGREIGETLRFARGIGRVGRDPEARELWQDLYRELAEEREGLAGAVLARSEAHVLRLSLLYALLDRSPSIGVRHLHAALALWQYVERSIEHIFGDLSGDTAADTIARALRRRGALSRTQIRDLFGRHANEGRIETALQHLAVTGKATAGTQSTGGRPVEIWTAAA